MPHSKTEIDAFLHSCFFAVLSYQDGEALKSDVFIFSHHIDGKFYLSTRKTAENYQAMKN